MGRRVIRLAVTLLLVASVWAALAALLTAAGSGIQYEETMRLMQAVQDGRGL